MEKNIFEKLTELLKQNKTAALATLTQVDGSSPGKEGFMMLILEDGKTIGTIGGGNVENIVIKLAKNCLKNLESKKISFDLSEGGGTGMSCGGKNEVFIKVFFSKPKLLVVGGGHIAMELYKLSQTLNFTISIFDNRPEFCNTERFPNASELFAGDVAENLKNYPIDENCYIVIVTHGHIYDEVSLRAVIKSKAAYIGMIGSKKKVPLVFNKLLNEGISKQLIKKVYSPIGLKLGGGSPAEIALSIMSEILLIKNKGNFEHCKLSDAEIENIKSH